MRFAWRSVGWLVKVVAATRPLLRGRHGVIACGHPLAVSAGMEIFRRGGGAMDAALAAAGVLSVVLPDACGLGGDAMILARQERGAVVAFNGSGAAPAMLDGVPQAHGASSAAVPGAVDCWEAAREQLGRLPMAELLQPAVDLARGGFPIGEALVTAIRNQRGRLHRWAAGWEPLEAWVSPGALVRLPRLAHTLDRIGKEPRALYESELAELIVASAGAAGGALGVADLALHRTPQPSPVSDEFGRARIWVQPPVSQAVLALMALRAVEETGWRGEADREHLSIEAIQAAFAYRDDVARPGAGNRLLRMPLVIDARRASKRGGPRGYTHTTAVATADEHGLVVSMLISIFDDFGCAVLVPELGFLLNDRLLGFSAEAGSANAPVGGRKPVHTLAPCLVEAEWGTFALATPGADGQVQSLVQLLQALLGGELGVPEAVEKPRWQVVRDRLRIERGFEPAVAEELEARGHQLEWQPWGNPALGAAVVAGLDNSQGTLFAAADRRREAWAAAW